MDFYYFFAFLFIGPMSKVFANGPGDGVAGQVIAKTQKMVLGA